MVDPQGFTVAFLLIVAGVMMVMALLYAFVRAVSYSTLQGLEEEWRQKYRRRESGREGEEAVAHELAFLPRGYRVLHRVYLTVPGRSVGQELDHLVIGPCGIVHIETKNDLGKIVITPEGDWLIRRDGRKYQGMRNPLAQIRRHGVVLREFLEREMPGTAVEVTGVVVLSRPETMLQGAANCPVPILKLERLPDFVTGLPVERPLPSRQVEELYGLFRERAIPVEEDMNL